MSIDQVKAVADAVLYEGYLLYPYRASSRKNQSRWQFGVLGPPNAASGAFAEEHRMEMQCLLEPDPGSPEPTSVVVRLRFLHLQVRSVERWDGETYQPVAQLQVGDTQLLSWEEAVEEERELERFVLDGDAAGPVETLVEFPSGEDIEPVVDAAGSPVARIVRRREALSARVVVGSVADEGLVRLTVEVANAHPDAVADKDAAIRRSLIGAHVLVEATGAGFVSLLEPPDAAAAAAARCRQHRCYPVLAGRPGSRDVVLGSPIIVYDYPEIAEQSAGALFDSTEIDEILTLRVMTMTDEEKAEARATDPRAAEIIRRCDEMSPETLQSLHGVLRDPTFDPGSFDPGSFDPGSFDPAPSTGSFDTSAFETGDVPWWDPAADESVRPETDSVLIDGVQVAKGSLVRVHPSRRADAQDLFFADQVARVTAVLSDVDGETHVALVLVDDPAADLHDWYGRYLYFSPDELEPLGAMHQPDPAHREEFRS